jgi:hypothetical protein
VQRLTILEVAIVVANALAQVEVALVSVTITIEEGSAENRDFAITFNGEVDVLGGARKAHTVPNEVSCCS